MNENRGVLVGEELRLSYVLYVPALFSLYPAALPLA